MAYWYFWNHGERSGPVRASSLHDMYWSGEIGPDTPVKALAGMAEPNTYADAFGLEEVTFIVGNPPRVRDGQLDSRTFMIQPHRGHLLLVYALLMTFLPFFLPLSAMMILTGKRDLQRMRRGEMDPRGKRLTNASMIVSVAGPLVMLHIWVAVAILL